MEEDQEKPSEPVSAGLPKPAIPPPDLSRPAPPPPSPLENLPKPDLAPPPPGPSAFTPPVRPAKVQETEEEDDEEEEDTTGAVPFNTRLIAAAIDVGVAMGVVITLTLLLPFLGRIGWLLYIGYMLTRDSLPFLGGQSVGKKAMKIKVVTAAGEPLTGKWEPSLIRNISAVVPPLPLVELFLLLTREDKPERGRRLGDEWAKTKVIFEPKADAEEA